MPLPPDVAQLVERFDRNRDAYRSGAYNETQARVEFINPFFEALGWDINNRLGASEAYKEVIHEATLKIGGYTKAPDYCFRTGGARRFFLEAKKPSVNLKDDIHPAFQLRRYAWSAKLPLSILTDFEEFAVYDCRIEPVKTDAAGTARRLYLPYTEYGDRWDEIKALFGREAVLGGSLERFAEEIRAGRGGVTVDAAFLREMNQWREWLAHDLAARNADLSPRRLNFAVQMTLDRIVFLRICEDRGTEPYGRLQALQNGGNVYARLCQLFREADDRYNSGLFHFKDEKNRADPPDDLTLSLAVGDDVLQSILKRLYSPDSPYEFSVIPIEILGQVYEQFLGKVIRIEDGDARRVVVEEKPEVRKAGGVYYTPTYIVDYIVRQTVGTLLENRTPKQAAALRILDPACGSGSFLIGAYQYLLDWHRDWYVKDGPQKHRKELYQGPGGAWWLTTTERKRILLNNIYGVDIDPQAVEVTKLSLLLKVLEGETAETMHASLSLFRERALPNLESNIKCGNSLIGPDFYDNRQMALFDEEAMYRINVFDWKANFPHVFGGDKPGFDAVIGNPPYIRIQALKEWNPIEVEHYKTAYRSAAKGNYDIYVVFVEKGLSLLNPTGRLGYILPHKFFNAQYGEPLRGIVAAGKHLSEVVHFGHQQVFKAASGKSPTTYTCLLFLNQSASHEIHFAKVNDLLSWRSDEKATRGLISAADVTASEWNFNVGISSDLFDRLGKMPLKLGDIADIFVGLQTSADDVFIMNLVEEGPQTLTLESRSLNSQWVFERGLVFPLVSGTDVKRYYDLPERQYILFPYSIHGGNARLIDLASMLERFPQTAAYLLQNKERLESREKNKLKGAAWHGYIYLKNMTRQNHVKLCVPRLVDRLYAAYDAEGNHFLDNVDVGGITLKPAYQDSGLLYLLALLNSKLLRRYFPSVSAPFRGGYMSANRQFLSQIPFRPIIFSDSADKGIHGQIVSFAEQMLDLHKRLAAARTPQEKNIFQRQIDATDKQIDQLVYELYELTDAEIALVEGSAT